MYEQILNDAIFVMLYAVVTVLAALGSCYLLFRRGNAFAADVTPPLRLRKWAAAFLAVIALDHLWYMPILFLSAEADIVLCDLVGGLLDSITFFPLSVVIMFTMLQDRQRPLWPVAVAFAPIVMLCAWSVVIRSYYISPVGYGYFLLLCIVLIIYMVREVRRYGRWLRDNYADLEHKEVWQSMVLLGVILLSYMSYTLTTKGTVYIYVLHTITLVLVIYLPWRVETLSELSPDHAAPTGEGKGGGEKADDIGLLLQQQCEATQLYLLRDLTVNQLAQALGTNRTYLSHYFAHQGTTYNAYINDLRIRHFECLYHEAVTAGRDVTAQELATQSGYHSYSTFSLAFKQRKGQSVKKWMSAEGTRTENHLSGGKEITG